MKLKKGFMLARFGSVVLVGVAGEAGVVCLNKKGDGASVCVSEEFGNENIVGVVGKNCTCC
jgi:hypothetical protein